MPLHFGGMSDPFQAVELRYRVSEAALRVLQEFDYPTVISTRGVLVAESPYIDILRSMTAVVVQFSLSSSDDRIASRSEPTSFAPSTILRCMESLSKSDINVTCRWQPYIPGVSESPREFVQRVARTGCAHLGFEHLKIPLERNDAAWQKFGSETGLDFLSTYLGAGAKRDGREFVLPAAAKRETVQKVAAEARKAGMTFGAADNEFQYLSDTSCCCSGADRFPGFENFFKHQIGYALRKCKGRRITYRAIEDEWVPEGSVDRFLNSKSRISTKKHGASTIRDHIRKRWNQLGVPGSPTSFFGIVQDGIAADGTNIYRWAHD